MTDEQIKAMAEAAYQKYLINFFANREDMIFMDRAAYIKGYCDAVKAIVVG